MQDELELTKLCEQGMSHADTDFKLGIPHSTISTILKTKVKVSEEIKNTMSGHTKINRKQEFIFVIHLFACICK